MTPALFLFDNDRSLGEAVAGEMGVEPRRVSLHRFPDAESLVTVDKASRTSILFRSLDHPDAKLVELLLAADALRRNGAERVILVAPYLAYQRQDRAFAPGQAVAQQVIGKLIADHFDGLITVDPHLHRTKRLGDVVPEIPIAVVSATPLFIDTLAPHRNLLIAAPDGEAAQWAEPVALARGCDFIVGTKRRSGDREVILHFDRVLAAAGRDVAIIDDLLSTGTTMARAVAALHAAAPTSIEIFVTHCLAHDAALARLIVAGAGRLHATDSVDSPISDLSVAPLLARTIEQMVEEMP